MIIFAIIICAAIGFVCAFIAGGATPVHGKLSAFPMAFFLACGAALTMVAIVLALGVAT